MVRRILTKANMHKMVLLHYNNLWEEVLQILRLELPPYRLRLIRPVPKGW